MAWPHPLCLGGHPGSSSGLVPSVLPHRKHASCIWMAKPWENSIFILSSSLRSDGTQNLGNDFWPSSKGQALCPDWGQTRGGLECEVHKACLHQSQEHRGSGARYRVKGAGLGKSCSQPLHRSIKMHQRDSVRMKCLCTPKTDRQKYYTVLSF